MRFFAVTLFAITVAAAPSPGTTRDVQEESVVEHLLAVDHETEKRVRNYWSPDRITSIDHDEVTPSPYPVPEDERRYGAEYMGSGAVPSTIVVFYSPKRQKMVLATAVARRHLWKARMGQQS